MKLDYSNRLKLILRIESLQIFYIAMVVKSAVDIDANKNFQAELTDLDVDCATTDNKDTWWCKAVTSMLVDGDLTFF